MKAIAARAFPIPDAIDIYFLDAEYEACEKTALQAVFEVQDEVNDLEQQAERLNHKMTEVADDIEAVTAIQSQLELVYEKLDDLDVNTAEARASSILYGLGFTTQMQGMMTKEFSGGWRMRVALARALFLKPEVRTRCRIFFSRGVYTSETLTVISTVSLFGRTYKSS